MDRFHQDARFPHTTHGVRYDRLWENRLLNHDRRLGS